MKLIFGAVLQWLACGLGATLFALAIWAFGCDLYNPITGEYYDGFGRLLRPGGPDPHGGVALSPGLTWEIVDTIIAIVCFALVAGLYKAGSKLKRNVLRGTENERKTGQNGNQTGASN